MSSTKYQLALNSPDSGRTSISPNPTKSNNAKRTQQLTNSKATPQKKRTQENPRNTQENPGFPRFGPNRTRSPARHAQHSPQFDGPGNHRPGHRDADLPEALQGIPYRFRSQRQTGNRPHPGNRERAESSVTLPPANSTPAIGAKTTAKLPPECKNNRWHKLAVPVRTPQLPWFPLCKRLS
jgi:hypothetical protein